MPKASYSSLIEFVYPYISSDEIEDTCDAVQASQVGRVRRQVVAGDGLSINDLARDCRVSHSWFTRILRLAFLAPDITAAILAGQMPIELFAKRLEQAC